MFKKRCNMVGRTIPWCHFNRPDGALFSVKAAVSKALLLKVIMANWFMSSLILPCHKWFDYIFTDIPLIVVFREVQVMKTPFKTHQTFAKLVTQNFFSQYNCRNIILLVTIISTSFWKTFRMISKRSRLTSHQVDIHISTWVISEDR